MPTKPSGNGTRWIQTKRRHAIYARDQHRCCVCQRTGVLLSLDHYVPRSKGGTHRSKNLFTSCFSCNSARQDRPLRAFLIARYGAEWAVLVLQHIRRQLRRKVR